MTDDLVKRLRDIGYCSPEDVAEAADRIEKLEAALRFYANDENYRQVWDDQFRTWVTDVLSDNGRIARKALEGKDD
jgi:hypothetical protein